MERNSSGSEMKSDIDYKTLAESFLHPPDSARPGVYWYFMDGNLSKEAMTADLESMKEAGIGNLVFLEVNVGVPRGKVDFLSEEWQDHFSHAVKEAERLGIEITMGVGPGWTGSGGPWVKMEESMKHLVASSTTIQGPGRCSTILALPPPRQPYFGEAGLTPAMRKQWLAYYEDVVVLAFPTPEAAEQIKDIDEKALVYRAPYSSRPEVKPFLPAPAQFPNATPGSVIPESKVIDVTEFMQSDGQFSWEAPEGAWTIMRFCTRNNGAVTRPAPEPGLGFECDKFNAEAFDHHFEAFLKKLIEKTGLPKPGSKSGWTFIHMDSWEMGAQNWTDGFREEFQKRRGYDPLPWLPTYSGRIVGSLEQSERFLWDLRITSQELILENHAGRIKEIGKEYGFGLSIEPYDMNPTADLDLGSLADVPMCEFWSRGFGFNTSFSSFESSSIAHIHGRPVLSAEAFTAFPEEAWKNYPGAMKDQGDWAFCTGINRFVYHTFAHKPLGDDILPGMTMGPYGVHWDRGQTWWHMSDAYHRYITRCQYVLQQGRTIADVLYMTPEGAPHIFRPPMTALTDNDTIPDRMAYNFDGISPLMLMELAAVKDGKIIFPSGASYEILVLPMFETMTPELLERLSALAENGASIIGSPPLRSPSLVNYPDCDLDVKALSEKIWGGFAPPADVTEIPYGKGKFIWGGGLSEKVPGDLYPHYNATSSVLRQMKVNEDFISKGPVRYTHRRMNHMDVYFVSNRTNECIHPDLSFRVNRGKPELWDPITGKIRSLPQYSHHDGMTSIPMEMDAYQSFFVVFPRHVEDHAEPVEGSNFATKTTVRDLKGPWKVSFDSQWGGPGEVVFEVLEKWTDRPEEGIKYYSGTAIYRKAIEIEDEAGPMSLHLGKVNHMARVILNGKDLGVVWTAPWQVDISEALKQGENQLEIQVANLWINRLIGDEFKLDDGVVDGQWPAWLMEGTPRNSGRYTFTTHRYYTRNSPLDPSGLLGPVTLQTHQY
ncbi:MAG: glycosyl hydrolase [Bacteroidales bacterium]|nr:glycosyl hydrolase [Bacteroidales bacterium]